MHSRKVETNYFLSRPCEWKVTLLKGNKRRVILYTILLDFAIIAFSQVKEVTIVLRKPLC